MVKIIFAVMNGNKMRSNCADQIDLTKSLLEILERQFLRWFSSSIGKKPEKRDTEQCM